MAVSSATTPAGSTAGTEHQTVRAASPPDETAKSDVMPSAASARAQQAAAAQQADPARQAAPAQPPAPFRLTLHFDQETQRMILEASDPVSGFVIFQMPPKYIIKQFSGSVSAIAPARGHRVDAAV